MFSYSALEAQTLMLAHCVTSACFQRSRLHSSRHRNLLSALTSTGLLSVLASTGLLPALVLTSAGLLPAPGLTSAGLFPALTFAGLLFFVEERHKL